MCGPSVGGRGCQRWFEARGLSCCVVRVCVAAAQRAAAAAAAASGEETGAASGAESGLADAEASGGGGEGAERSKTSALMRLKGSLMRARSAKLAKGAGEVCPGVVFGSCISCVYGAPGSVPPSRTLVACLPSPGRCMARLQRAVTQSPASPRLHHFATRTHTPSRSHPPYQPPSSCLLRPGHALDRAYPLSAALGGRPGRKRRRWRPLWQRRRHRAAQPRRQPLAQGPAGQHALDEAEHGRDAG